MPDIWSAAHFASCGQFGQKETIIPSTALSYLLLSLKVHISTESVLSSLMCFAMSPSFEKIPFLLRRFHYIKPILRSVQLMSM